MGKTRCFCIYSILNIAYKYLSNITREGVRQHDCDCAEDNHSRADIHYNSTTSSVILLLYNSSTSTIN